MAPSSANQHHRTEPPKHQIHVAIDYGTKKLSAGFVRVPETCKDPSQCKCTIIPLQNSKEEVPQMVGYRSNAEDARSNAEDTRSNAEDTLDFTWGNELFQLEKTNSDDVVAVFECLKLATFGEDAHARRLRRDIEKRLEELDVPEDTVEDLFVKHMRCVLQVCENDVIYHHSDAVSDNRCIFFGVPEIMDLGARETLVMLLEKAGLPEVHLFSETEAAGAFYLARHIKDARAKDSLDQLFQDPGEVLVFDAGGWTANLAVYEIHGDTKDGARTAMKATGKKSSLPLGSESVTENFQEHCFRAVGRDGGLRRLGLTRDALDRQAARKFEAYKKDFEDYDLMIIRIRGRALDEDGLKAFQDIEIAADQIQEWMNEASSGHQTMINQNRSNRLRAIITCGGFMRSTYLLGILREKYEGVRIIAGSEDEFGDSANAVVRGAASRFLIEPAKVPSNFGLGWLQDELYVPGFHHDPRPMYEWRFKCVENGQDYTYAADRWKTLLKLGHDLHTSSTTPDVVEAFLEWKFTARDMNDAKTHYTWLKQLFWTSEDIKAGATTNTASGYLRPAIKPYKFTPIEIPADEAEKYPETAKGEYKATLRFQAHIHGMDTSLTVDRAPPEHEFYPVNKPGKYITLKDNERWIPVPSASVRLSNEKYLAFLQRHDEKSKEVPPPSGGISTPPSDLERHEDHNDGRPSKRLRKADFHPPTSSSASSRRQQNRDSDIGESESLTTNRAQTLRASTRLRNMVYNSPSQAGPYNTRHWHKSQGK